jgi:catechol 2,3-dioxygenase-like lactoylglutathione lyase family enzyme
MPEFEVQYLRVFVRDFDRALRFYTGTLGLTATVAYEGWARSTPAPANSPSSASTRRTTRRSWSRCRASDSRW